MRPLGTPPGWLPRLSGQARNVHLVRSITYPSTMPTLKAGEAGGLVTQTQSHSRTIKMDSSRD